MGNPLTAANRAIERWVLRRVKRQPGPVRIRRNRIYILPTRQGWVFALLVLVMLLGAMNYSNSMAYALAFLLGGLGLVCMHHTHGTLLNLELRPARSPAIFAGETARFAIELHNPTRRPKLSIAAGLSQQDAARDWADIPPAEQSRLYVSVPEAPRGLLAAPRFTVNTSFPLGLFNAWNWTELDNAVLVYPKPADERVELPQAGDGGDTLHSDRAGDDDFAGVREYQRGDSRAAVHWKSVAKLGADNAQLVVKQFAASTAEERVLDFNALASRDVETRLSQLCRAVLDAHADGAAWALILPGEQIDTASGDAHRDRCLKALALFDAGART